MLVHTGGLSVKELKLLSSGHFPYRATLAGLAQVAEPPWTHVIQMKMMTS